MSKPVMLPPSKTLRPDLHRSAHRPDGPVWKAAPEWEIILLSCFLFWNVPDIPSVRQTSVCSWWHGGATAHICHKDLMKTDFTVKLLTNWIASTISLNYGVNNSSILGWRVMFAVFFLCNASNLQLQVCSFVSWSQYCMWWHSLIFQPAEMLKRMVPFNSSFKSNSKRQVMRTSYFLDL